MPEKKKCMTYKFYKYKTNQVLKSVNFRKKKFILATYV